MSEKNTPASHIVDLEMFDTAASNEALCLASRPNLALDLRNPFDSSLNLDTINPCIKIDNINVAILLFKHVNLG